MLWVRPPPSSSIVTSSPVTVRITSGPVMNIWLVWSTMMTKSVSAGVDVPAGGAPITRLIWGMTPEACVAQEDVAVGGSESTPSWMRAPPPSFMPISGQPVLVAKSMILAIFAPYTSPSEPPKTPTSWLNTQTGRPWIAPTPMITPSP